MKVAKHIHSFIHSFIEITLLIYELDEEKSTKLSFYSFECNECSQSVVFRQNQPQDEQSMVVHSPDFCLNFSIRTPN